MKKTQQLTFEEVTKLYHAVLEDALNVIEQGARTNMDASFWEATEWLFDDDDKNPFSFVIICRVLEMNSTQIRDRVVRALRKCHIVRVNDATIDLNKVDENYDTLGFEFRAPTRDKIRA